jgi:hypothetical protein
MSRNAFKPLYFFEAYGWLSIWKSKKVKRIKSKDVYEELIVLEEVQTKAVHA